LSDLTRSIAHRADRQQFGVDLTVFAAVPDFSCPEAHFMQPGPQRSVKLFALAPGTEHARVLAQYFFARVAGNAGKGIVYVQKRTTVIGHHNALARMVEYQTRQLQLLFSMVAVRYVAGYQNEPVRCDPVFFHRCYRQLKPTSALWEFQAVALA